MIYNVQVTDGSAFSSIFVIILLNSNLLEKNKDILHIYTYYLLNTKSYSMILGSADQIKSISHDRQVC